MTLYKQIVLGMVAVFSLLMVSVLFIELSTTRSNLEQQQRTEVLNTINTVGLALSPYLQQGDRVSAESVINALFDGSSYSKVTLSFMDMEPEIVREYPIHSTTAPDWFVELGLFDVMSERRIVTSGWLQLAEVEIISHPGSAYTQLWLAFERLIFAFGLIFLFGLFALSLIVRFALKPLHLIVNQMEKVASHQFGEPLQVPKTTELVSVVEGINLLSAQVEKSFQAQANEAKKLRERAYVDPIAQIGNRVYFMTQLDSWLAENAIGGVLLLETCFVHDFYAKSYQTGDKVVQEVAQQLTNILSPNNAIVARISVDEFAVIVASINETELKVIAGNIVSGIHDLNSDPTGTAASDFALGVAYNEERRHRGELLTMLDNALAKAKADRSSAFGYIAQASHHTLIGKQRWKSLVEEAINDDLVRFRMQDASYKDGSVYHCEVFSSIVKDGEQYSANQYLFALEQLNATHIFDEYVVKSILKLLKKNKIIGPVAINVSQSSISQPSFIRNIRSILQKNRGIADQLHFEIPEKAFLHEPHHTALLCHAIREAGAEFGVDNFGHALGSLDYIHEYRPTYVKLDYLFTYRLDNEQSLMTLVAVSRTAHDLGIKTIATRIETQEQLTTLSEHLIEVFQGFIIENSNTKQKPECKILY